MTTKRILHVVGRMTRGGVETWLIHVLRHIDRQQFQMDFLVHTTEPCAYDDEIRSLGSRIIPCLHTSKPLEYARNFKRILREYGPYDVVHSHVHHYSGYVLWLAAQAGVPARMAHSHNDQSMTRANAGFPRRMYLRLTELLLQRYATAGLAVSRKAAIDLYGPHWDTDRRWQILYCGIDLEPFCIPVDPTAVRAEFGIPANAFVVGHVGRFVEQKNHDLLVEIAREILKVEPLAYFLLVGEGPLRPQIEAKVAQLGIAERFVFAGSRPDVVRLLKGAMDAFLFPSLYEGLPLTVLEAQAADLPITISDSVTSEVSVVPELIQWLSCAQPPSEWAQAVRLKARTTLPSSKYVLEKVANTKFNICVGIQELQNLYESSK